MYRSMYDILNKSIDYKKEYEKLWDMIFKGLHYILGVKSYSLVEMFDVMIVEWKYKGTKCSSQEVMEELELLEHPNTSPEEAILKLCDFIINIRTFLLCHKEKIDIQINKAEAYNRKHTGTKKMFVPSRITIVDKKMIDIVYEILGSLNYEILIKEEYQCFIIKKNIDAEETAKVVENDDISTKILQYNDYRTLNNIEIKKEILLAMATYFEGTKTKVREFNENLESDIGYLLNNFNIRHNNIDGQYAKAYMSQIGEKELLKIYDMTYFLLLIAMRGIELPQFNREVKLLKQKYNY